MTARNTRFTMSDADTLGARLRRYRRSKGWTQEELASKLGLDRSSVACYEGGRRTPDIETIKKLSGLFGLSIDVLCGWSVAPETLVVRGDPDIDVWLRSTKDLSDADREELLRFADWLRSRPPKGVTRRKRD